MFNIESKKKTLFVKNSVVNVRKQKESLDLSG